MSGAAPVGIVGAYGGVGRAAVRRLRAWGVGPLRVGGRRPELARRLVEEELDGEAEAAEVDVERGESLARFCAGCRLVVSCAGPSHRLLDRVCRAALAAGASCVEPAGDEAVHERLRGGEWAGRTVVLSAGLVPGLSGLLPRCVAARWLERPARLTAYAGGRGRLTPAAAADYLAGSLDRTGESLAAWRGGRRVPRALAPLREVELPFFPGRVTAQPFLSAETERVARSLGLDEARWYSVLDGRHVPAALARLQGARSGEAPDAAAAELELAADLDLFGHQPYQLIVLQMEGESAGRPACRTLVLRARDGIELTGAVAALAACAVLRGEVPPGVHYMADLPAPGAWWERLSALPEVQALQVVDGAAADGAFEEGEL